MIIILHALAMAVVIAKLGVRVIIHAMDILTVLVIMFVIANHANAIPKIILRVNVIRSYLHNFADAMEHDI